MVHCWVYSLLLSTLVIDKALIIKLILVRDWKEKEKNLRIFYLMVIIVILIKINSHW